MAISYDSAVDFMDMRTDSRLWTRMTDARPGFVPIAGQYAIVGCEDADPAIARIISVDIKGGIQPGCSMAAWMNTVTC